MGLALWNPDARLARPLAPLFRKKLQTDLETLRNIVSTHEIELIVVGLPIHLDGSETASTENARFWVEKLKSTFEVPIETIDESLSSQEAESILRTKGRKLSGSKAQGERDSIAAALILEEYMRAGS